MKRFALLFLVACSGDTFTGFEGGQDARKPDADSSTDADSGVDPVDSGGPDAKDSGLDSSTKDANDASAQDADAGSDAWVCPTGVQACQDAISVWCQRYQQCGQQCGQVSTNGCGFKSTCETACINDIQSASCMKILQSSSPAFVSNNCMGLWP